MNAINTQRSLVVDVTYKCNASCKYCQWGDHTNPTHDHQPFDSVLLPRETLSALGTERVVFSGGEPLLRADLEKLVQHYRQMNLKSIVTITNGILLNAQRLSSLVEAGLTGVTFSIDAIDPSVLKESRSYSANTCERIFQNVKMVVAFARDGELELGMNCVLNASNAKPEVLLELVEFCNAHNVATLKFSPVFDDGYAGRTAPHLLLNSSHAESIRSIGAIVVSRCKAGTNPLGFWHNVADLVSGKRLLGEGCNLADRQALAIRGELKFCAWLDSAKYGSTVTPLAMKRAGEARAECVSATPKCRTGPWCFCLQKLEHVWPMA